MHDYIKDQPCSSHNQRINNLSPRETHFLFFCIFLYGEKLLDITLLNNF